MSEIPRWLELQAQIDFARYELQDILKRVRGRAPISVLIDEATGYDKAIEADVKVRVAEIQRMESEFYGLLAGDSDYTPKEAE